eukprot:2635656-Amphidinium_carterae.1
MLRRSRCDAPVFFVPFPANPHRVHPCASWVQKQSFCACQASERELAATQQALLRLAERTRRVQHEAQEAVPPVGLLPSDHCRGYMECAFGPHAGSAAQPATAGAARERGAGSLSWKLMMSIVNLISCFVSRGFATGRPKYQLDHG